MPCAQTKPSDTSGNFTTVLLHMRTAYSGFRCLVSLAEVRWSLSYPADHWHIDRWGKIFSKVSRKAQNPVFNFEDKRLENLSSKQGNICDFSVEGSSVSNEVKKETKHVIHTQQFEVDKVSLRFYYVRPIVFRLKESPHMLSHLNICEANFAKLAFLYSPSLPKTTDNTSV